MKPTEPKAVKAWAVVDGERDLSTAELEPNRVEATILAEHITANTGEKHYAIPVTISYGHRWGRR